MWKKISGESLSIITNLQTNCHIHISLCDLYKKHELVVLMVGIMPTPSSFDKLSWQQTQMSGFQHLKGQANFGVFEKETIKQFFSYLRSVWKWHHVWTYDYIYEIKKQFVLLNVEFRNNNHHFVTFSRSIINIFCSWSYILAYITSNIIKSPKSNLLLVPPQIVFNYIKCIEAEWVICISRLD